MPHQCIEDLIRDYFPTATSDEVILCAGALVGVFIEASSRVIYGHLPFTTGPPRRQCGEALPCTA